MKIEFITPSEQGFQSKRFEPFPTTPLLWQILGSLTPSDVELRVQDEHYRPLDYKSDADIIAITVATPVAPRAYEIGSIFHRQGKKVVYGGAHITQIQRYSEIANEPFVYGNATSIFVGDAEDTWPEFITHFQAGRCPDKVYDGKRYHFARTIIPRKNLIRRAGLQKFFPSIASIESSRGCPAHCSYCCSNGRYTTKPIHQVLAEMKSAKSSYFNFIDSNLGGNQQRFTELLTELQTQPYLWSGSAFLPSLYGKGKQLYEAGCRMIYIGFESVIQKSAAEIGKPYIQYAVCQDIVEELHDNGIAVIGSFIFGLDHDDASVFDQTLQFCEKLRLEDASFHLLMPYPGTPIFDKFRAEGRLKVDNFPADWAKFTRDQIVYQPTLLSEDELIDGYHRVLWEFYSLGHIRRRLRRVSLTGEQKNIWIANLIKSLRSNRCRPKS